MSAENIKIVERYYAAMQQHDMAAVKSYLHPNISLTSPLAQISGIDTVMAAAQKFSSMIKSLTIHAKFSSGDQVMLAYEFDLIFNESIENLRAAVLMTLQEKRIINIEMFYDARLFEQLQTQIFNNS